MKNTPTDEAASPSGAGAETGTVRRKRATARSAVSKPAAAATPGKKAAAARPAKRTRTAKSKEPVEPEVVQAQLPLQEVEAGAPAAGQTPPAAPEAAESGAGTPAEPAPRAVKRKTARKTAARKSARRAATETVEPAPDEAAAAPAADPAKETPAETKTPEPPSSGIPAETPSASSGDASGGAASVEAAPAAEAAGGAGAGTGAPGDRGDEESSPGGPPAADARSDSEEPRNPDEPPRRLTKWERWKLRKEKYKLMKQQRYLEKQARGGGAPVPRANGAPPPEGGAAGGSPERPPRPEPVLGPPEPCSGLLEISGKGFAFLRPKERGFEASPSDPFVSPDIVRNLGLREGVWVEGMMRRGGRGPQLTEVISVNGRSPEAYRSLPLFEELTAINPNKRYLLETIPSRHTTRLIDFISPIGRGQRGLIVAAPRAGKTTFLQHIAEAILENYEDVKVIVLLVDERPEEVTEIARALPGAEIMASSNDQDPRDHIRMAHLAVERAKRLVEAGEHVFMLLDSITRLARAFNNAARGGGGKAMSGGVDSRALEGPRRLFASARNTREAGSLTIIATALVETNNKGDELIFQEFKGTGNMELVLDRRIAQQYVYPAVDIFKSGTRREELLLPPHQLEKVHLIRRGLAGHKPVEAVERLLHFMNRFPSNAQMLVEIKARE